MLSILSVIGTVLFLAVAGVAVAAACGKLGKRSDSKSRSVFTVVQAAVILLVITLMFSIFSVDYSSYDLEGLYFSIAAPCFTLFYLLVVTAAELLVRKLSDKVALPYICLSAGALVIIAAFTAIVAAVSPIYYPQTLIASIGLAVACLMHTCNFMLGFEKGWQRTAVTVMNGAVFLLMAAVEFFVMSIGAETFSLMEGASIDFVSVMIIAVVAVIVILPSLMCIKTILTTHFKENDEDDID